LGGFMISHMFDRYLDYTTAIDTSSESVKNGVTWLEDYLITNKEKTMTAEYTLEFYVLSKFNSPIVKKFIQKANTDEFWQDDFLFDDYADYVFYYLAQLGISGNHHFKTHLKNYLDFTISSGGQHLFGNLGISLLTLVSLGMFPLKQELLLKDAIERVNEDDYEEEDLENLALIGLALFELDARKYNKEIEKILRYLLAKQKQKGYWGVLKRRKYRKYSIKTTVQKTFYVVYFLSRVRFLYPTILSNSVFEKANKWVKSLQDSNGSWIDDSETTSYGLLTLISLGEGPKVPYEYVEMMSKEIDQRVKHIKPKFLVTNPYRAETSIKDTLESLFLNAEKRVWIISRYITEFFPDIIKLHKDKPQVDIRVITLPKSEKSGYKGEGKRFLDPAYDMLQRLLGDSFRVTSIIHARLYIIDDQVLVTSADLTPEQLKNEFNAGILTMDQDVLSEAEKFFLDIWEITGKNRE